MTGSTIADSVGSRLRFARETAGLSARELDRLAGRKEGHASSVEAGSRPRADLLERFASVLGLSLDWLVRGIGRTPGKRRIQAAVREAGGAAVAPR